MPGLWDSKMKQLVGEVPQDFVQWLVQGAQYKEELSPHLSDRNINADVLYSILIEELPYLLHIEFQRRGEKQMAKRVWEYNVLATCKFNSPVYSFVIYLKKDSPIAETPYIWRLHDTQEVHRFHFNVIKLWEIPTETLLTAGFKGLLPLAPLTRDGSQKEVIEEVINRLAPYEETLNRDLLALTYGVAALVFANANDQKWLKWRFGMLEEIINESWAFKEYEQRNQEKWRKEGIERGRKEGLEQGLERGLEQGLERGLEQGLERGLEQGLERGLEQGLERGLEQGLKKSVQIQCQLLITFVRERFPSLLSLAEERITYIDTLEVLQSFILKVGLARDEQEARQYLLSVVSEEIHDK